MQDSYWMKRYGKLFPLKGELLEERWPEEPYSDDTKIEALASEIDRLNERISDTANNQTVYELKHLVNKLMERVNRMTQKQEARY